MNRTEQGIFRRGYRRSAGFVALTVLMLAMLAFVGALTMMSVSQSQIRSAAQSQNRMTGLVLAEAGVDDAVLQISSAPDFTGRSGSLYEDPPTNSRIFGTYQTTVTKVDEVVRRVTSVGTNPNGTKVTVVAIVNVDTRALGNAAIMANGAINVGGTMLLNSIPTPDMHISHVYANGNVSMGGSSFVDGVLMAAGTVTGTAYYPSQTGVAPFPYPNSTTTDKWRADWISAAQAGGTINAVKKTATITAPKYINGDITLNNSEAVTLNGSGVIYVNGNVNLTAQSTLTNGVTLVVSGTFTQGGQSTYKITTGLTPTPTLVVYGTGYGMSSDVIQLTGGSLANQQGIIYAVNGSIKVAGGSTFVGALIAGGANAQVSTTGGYNHYFPDNMASAVKFPSAANVVAVTEL